MRDYIFRGKRKDNGEWVIGKGIDTNFIEAYILHGWEDASVGLFEVDDIEVIPETVGQYTGLTDKNGKMIFEGDIVNQNRNGFDTLYVAIFTDEDVGSCGCCYPQFDGVGFVFESVKGTRANSFDMYPLEIIGNIHDNKEMLKVQ